MIKVETDTCRIKFGQYIKDLRERKRMSQQEVAEKAGVSQSYVCRVEQGTRDAELALAYKLCEVVGGDLRDFTNKFL